MKKQLRFSILIPVYKGSRYLSQALESIYRQNFPFYEIIIADDNDFSDRIEIQKTKNIIDSFKDKRITYVKNKTNLGSQTNIKKLASYARGDVLFYLCQDDVLIGSDGLQKTHDAFFLANDVKAVTRPFYWFDDKVENPIRAVKPYNQSKDTILSVFDGEKAVRAILGSVGQISGLAYKKKFLEIGFHKDVFPGHIYPFAGILKKYRCVFLKDFTVAVRVKSSQSRNIASVYDRSPLGSWVKMLNFVFKGKKFEKVREQAVKNIATHYEGLIQIKNFAPAGSLKREIVTHLKVFRGSFFDPIFWFFVILTVLTPKRILLFLSDNYKRLILSRLISSPFLPPARRNVSRKD